MAARNVTHNFTRRLGEQQGARAVQGPGFRVQGSEKTKSPNPEIPKSPNPHGPHPNPLPKGEGTRNGLLPKGEGTRNGLLPKGEGTIRMRSAVLAIVLVLLSAFTAELSAQTLPDRQQSEATGESVSSSPALKPHNPANRLEPGKKPDAGSSLFTLIGSLVLVLGLFFAIAWAFRRMSPTGTCPLPVEVFEVLGRGPLAGRQQAHLLRCGNKVLLVSVGATGVSTLTEITDPAEVDRLTNLCRQARPVATTALHRIFRQKEGGHE
jgi:flagellar biogenesis protein FliO